QTDPVRQTFDQIHALYGRRLFRCNSHVQSKSQDEHNARYKPTAFVSAPHALALPPSCPSFSPVKLRPVGRRRPQEGAAHVHHRFACIASDSIVSKGGGTTLAVSYERDEQRYGGWRAIANTKLATRSAGLAPLL